MKTRASLALMGLAVSAALILVFSIQAYGQETYNIPSWIKNNAKWWSEGQIGDSDFIKGIQYLIENNILHVSNSQTTSKTVLTNGVPQVTTDKQTYHVGEEIKISGSGFEKGRLKLVIDETLTIDSTNYPHTIWLDSHWGIPEDQQWGSGAAPYRYGLSPPISIVNVDESGKWNLSLTKYAEISFGFDNRGLFGPVLDSKGNYAYTLSTLPQGTYRITAVEETHLQQITNTLGSNEYGNLIFKEAHNYFQIK